MVEKGNEVLYGKTKGLVDNIVGEIALVKMEDGKLYSIDIRELVILDESTVKEYSVSDLKKVDFINRLAKDMQLAGIIDLSIKNGEVKKFNRHESLDEKKKRLRTAAIVAADVQAEKEFEKEK